MNDLSYEIEQMYIEGYSMEDIARELNCDIRVVFDWFTVQHLRDVQSSSE
jgi:transposase-like protein